MVSLEVDLMVFPKKRAVQQNVEKYKFTVQGDQRRGKAYIQRVANRFPKGIVRDTAIFTAEPCSHRHDTIHLGLCRPQPR